MAQVGDRATQSNDLSESPRGGLKWKPREFISPNGRGERVARSDQESGLNPNQGQVLIDPDQVMKNLNLSRSELAQPSSAGQFREQGDPFVSGGKRQQEGFRPPPFSLQNVDRSSFLLQEEADQGETEPTSVQDQDREQLPPPITSAPNSKSQESTDVTSPQLPQRETVVENYPSGKPRVSRSVAMDDQGNYFNDGPWKVFNEDGELVAEGQYERGVMVGLWGRRHVASEGGLFSTKPFNMYTGPFDSYATFKAGRLHGQWVIYDNLQRKVFEIGYENGNRNGIAKWYFPDRQLMRSAKFKDGLLDGEVLEWDASPDHRLIARDVYFGGRKIVRTTARYRPEQKQSEATYLDRRLAPDGLDNWWDAKPAPLVADGQKIQQGPVASWYPNQQPQYKGQFKDNHPIGQFFWWHENGNRKTVGYFDPTGQRDGRWTWWHANGMKSFEGRYDNGRPQGVWRSWNREGQLLKEKDYDAPNLMGPELTGEGMSQESVDPNQTGAESIDAPNSESEAGNLPIPEQPTESGASKDRPEFESIDPIPLLEPLGGAPDEETSSENPAGDDN